jgi:hypothetical protein
MFDNLSGLAMGIITFSIVIGVGTVVLYNFGGAVGCPHSLYPTFNVSSGNCIATNGSAIANSGTSYTNINYMNGNLGQSGLAGWTPSIIAISVGLLFLGAFMLKGDRK